MPQLDPYGAPEWLNQGAGEGVYTHGTVVAPKLGSGHAESVISNLFDADDWDTTQEVLDNLIGEPIEAATRAVGTAARATGAGLVGGLTGDNSRGGLLLVVAVAAAAFLLMRR